MAPRTLVGATLLGLILMGGSAALAEPPAADVEARQLYDEGIALHDAGKYGEALKRLQAAYERRPHAKAVLAIGTTLRKLGRNAEALEAYQRYQRDPEANPALQKKVDAAIKELEAQVARIEIAASQPDTRGTVDGRRVRIPITLTVDPGSHVVTAEKDGFVRAEETVVARAHDVKVVHLALVASAPKVTSEPILATGGHGPDTATPPLKPEEVVTTPPAPVRPPEDRVGIELGVRGGYARASGKLDAEFPIGTPTDYALPVGLEALVRIRRDVLLGALFQYAWVPVNEKDPDNKCCEETSALNLALIGRYRIPVTPSFNAWGGVGVGYERFTFGGSATGADTYHSLELLRAELGGDFALVHRVTLGPYASFSVDRYLTKANQPEGVQPGTHTWFSFGVRLGVAVWH